jgi:hypothetical protein
MTSSIDDHSHPTVEVGTGKKSSSDNVMSPKGQKDKLTDDLHGKKKQKKVSRKILIDVDKRRMTHNIEGDTRRIPNSVEGQRVNHKNNKYNHNINNVKLYMLN